MGEAVGFIGLGVMGGPMARNLLAAGLQVTVHNRSPEKARALEAAGATAAPTPRAVAEASTLIITMLPGAPEVAAVLTGPDGVLDGASQGALVVDMGTTGPLATRELARVVAGRGVRLLDAPVSGGDTGAREATLSIMVGGAPEDFARAEPVLHALGTTVVHVGPSGAGQVAKACNQIVVAVVIAAVSEALVLGGRAGVDPALLLDVLQGGLAANRVTEVRRRNLLEHDFRPGGKAVFHHRDLGYALETARAHGVALPVTAVVGELFGALVATGRGGLDHTALLTLLEDWAEGTG
jgi:2-hydroxy-3-oxopropionate reductase